MLPVGDVSDLAAMVGVPAESGAALYSRASGRWLLAFVAASGGGAVVKLGPPNDAGLAREADTLKKLHDNVGAMVRVPTLRWQGRWHDWIGFASEAFERLPEHAQPKPEDALTAATALAAARCGFVVHGDLAPWNIVPTHEGLALVDWEASRFERDPLTDLAHFVVSAGALLGSWSPRRAVSHLVDDGSVGWRYLEALGLDPLTAPGHLMRYLRRRSGVSAAPRRYEATMARLLTDPAVSRSRRGRLHRNV
jgi:aminoglycoside phosphotransferase (APT) family kinase protein